MRENSAGAGGFRACRWLGCASTNAWLLSMHKSRQGVHSRAHGRYASPIDMGAAGWFRVVMFPRLLTLAVCLVGSMLCGWASPMSLTFTTVKKGDPQAQLNSIAFGNGALVAVGTSSAFASTNGVDWQPLAIRGGNVVYGGNRFVVGNGGYWSSTNGFDWSGASVDDGPGNVTYGQGVFVGIGRSSIHYSFDGENWTKLQQHGSSMFWGVNYGNGSFVVFGAYSDFLPPMTGFLFGSSTNGTNWSIGRLSQGSRVIFPTTFAWGNFYTPTDTSPDCMNPTAWSSFSLCRTVKFSGSRLVGFRSNSPNIVISASEGFDAYSRPVGRYQYVTGVTNYLNDVAFDGSEYYFVGAGEIILKSKGVPAAALLTFGKIEGETVTLGVSGVAGMTYGLQVVGNDFVGARPTLDTTSILDFTLEGASTNISSPLYLNGAIYRLVER